MKKRKVLIGILVMICTLLFALPVQAKTTDIAKVMNKKVASAAKSLGLKRDYHKDQRSRVYSSNGSRLSTLMTFAPKGKYSASRTYIQGESYYKNNKGKWNAYINEKKYSINGVKIGMTTSKAYQKFTRNGWRKVWSGSTHGMYMKGAKAISLTLRNGRITRMNYLWQMESEE